MGKSRWNRMVSIPVKSLTPEELKEAIHEWAEGCDELERLLWACHDNGLETGGCHVDERSNYIQFAVATESAEQLKKCLSAAEVYGYATLQMMIGGNPYSGPNWHRTKLGVTCTRPNDVDSFFCNLTNALENGKYSETKSGFTLISDIAEFFEEKLAALEFFMSVQNHSEYEFRIILRSNERNWKYFNELFGSFGMVQEVEKKEKYSMISWYVNASSKEEFYDVLFDILEGIKRKWNLETPTEIMPDMGFPHKALLMQKKFGITPEGVKKMNDWINENYPRPDGGKVNY